MSDVPLFEEPKRRHDDGVQRTAKISDDGLYRYGLVRRWDPHESPFATFIMLNPSTADAERDDRTIRRCMGFARAWGMGGLHVLNLYAYRSTDPDLLWTVDDPVGPENDHHLTKHALAHANSGWPMVAGWGVNAKPDRVAEVLALPGMRHALKALGVTKSGAPRHPLYMPGDTLPIPWRPR